MMDYQGKDINKRKEKRQNKTKGTVEKWKGREETIQHKIQHQYLGKYGG